MCVLKSCISLTVFFLIYHFFNWRVIALQNFVGFCQISTWISHRYTYVPSCLNLLPISLPISPLWVVIDYLSEFPESYNKFPLAIYFIHGNVSFHVTLSIHFTLSSPLPMSVDLFSMSVSPLLPCEWILQYHFSRFHTYLLPLLLLSRFSRVWLCATLWTAACQASLSMGFSRQEY